MLILDVVITEAYDQSKKEFVDQTFRLEMEHSLASVSKWESHFEKPFLNDKEKTAEELFWYVQAMTLTPNVPPEVFASLNKEDVAKIDEYINAKMSATTFREATNQKKSTEVVTAELIYYWMISLNIWPECQHWHLGRLLTLIKVFNAKNAPAKKMSRSEQIAYQRAVNERQKKQAGTRG